MKKSFRLLLLAAGLFGLTANLSAGGGSSTPPLKGSYPIVLSHGMMGWGEDPAGGGLISAISLKYFSAADYLRSQGADVYIPTKTALNGNAPRAQQMKDLINTWMAAKGYTKVNIFGHSQGGTDARYMISNLGMASKVGVYTSVATPHRGSAIADIIDNVLPGWLQPYALAAVGSVTGILLYGNSKQDLQAGMIDLKVASAAAFNASTPNVSSVKYYSYGGQVYLNDIIQHPLMWPLVPINAIGGAVYGLGAANDGLVSIQSAKWGTWMGTPAIPLTSTGVDHLQSANNVLGNWFDLNGFYLSMAKNAMANQ